MRQCEGIADEDRRASCLHGRLGRLARADHAKGVGVSGLIPRRCRCISLCSRRSSTQQRAGPVAAQTGLFGFHMASCAVIYLVVGHRPASCCRPASSGPHGQPRHRPYDRHRWGPARGTPGRMKVPPRLIGEDQAASRLRRPGCDVPLKEAMDEHTQRPAGKPRGSGAHQASFERPSIAAPPRCTHRAHCTRTHARRTPQPSRTDSAARLLPRWSHQRHHRHHGGYATSTLLPENTSVLTVKYKINLLAPAEGDHIEAVGTALKSGRTLTVCRLGVFSVQGS